MPRDGSGNYTLPAGNPVVPQSIIETDWANPTMNDLAAAMSDSLSRSGQGGMLAPFLFADGSAGSPSISWSNESASGWYRAAFNDVRYSVSGVDVVQITDTGMVIFGVISASNLQPVPYGINIGGTGATTAANARINLGLQIGFNVQAWSQALQALSPLLPANDRLAYFTGATTAALATLTAYGRSLIAANDAAAARALLGLVIGTNVQAFNNQLQSISTSSTQGFLARSSSNSVTARSLLGTTNMVTVTNATGAGGNPVFSLQVGPLDTNTVFIPVLTEPVNLITAVFYPVNAMRVGNVVTMSSRVDLHPAVATTQLSIKFSLPWPSNFTSFEQCSGTIFQTFAQNQSSRGLAIVGVGPWAQINGVTNISTNNSYSYTLTYVIR